MDVESEQPNGDQMGGVGVSCGAKDWNQRNEMKELRVTFEYPHEKLMKITCQSLCRSLQILLISSHSKTVNRLCVGN